MVFNSEGILPASIDFCDVGKYCVSCHGPSADSREEIAVRVWLCNS